MKKLMKVVLITLMITSIVGCAKETNKITTEVEEGIDTNLEVQEKVQMVNPIIEYDTIEEAKEKCEFEIQIPTGLTDGYEIESICIINNELLEIVYKQEENELVYRQGKGQEDVSGDYTDYADSKRIEVGMNSIDLFGEGKTINLAKWTDEKYSYSLNINIGQVGMDETVIISILESI